MASSTAKLLASLDLDVTRWKRATASALGDIGKMESGFGRMAARAKQGIGTAATNIARLGVVAAGFVGSQIVVGINELQQLENATTSVDGAIQQLGLTGKVTSAQIAGWANDIERNVGAAFDDKAITSATATLLRFGKVTPENIRPAMAVMTDLAAKTGDVDSAATLLAKALADPEKAAGKLARSGVILTKAQQDQIKAMTKAGDVAGAQSLLLTELAKTTTGAAKASQGPLKTALSTLADAAEDARRALAIGFLPIITKVADRLTKTLADPRAISQIRDFGEGLASAFDKALDAASRIPWGTIGEGLKTAGVWAGKLFDAFTSMPPQVQSTIIALAGLNKLSGGAITSIVGELGKGLIKGVLNTNTAVMNVKAAVVNGLGGGGIPGVGGAAGTAGTVGGFLAPGAFAAALGPALAVAMVAVIPEIFRGAQGSGAREIATGTAAGTLSQTSVGMFSGLMPSFRTAVIEGTRPVVNTLTDERDLMRRNLSTLMDERDQMRGVKAATSLVAAKQEETRRAIKAIPAPVQTTNVRVDVKTYVSSRDITYKQNKAASVVTGHAVNRGALAADL